MTVGSHPRINLQSGRNASTTSTCEPKQIEKLRYMHRNPVKRGLVDRPEQWEWSSFRAYFLGESGRVRVKCQEWPIESKSRPVATFGDGNSASFAVIRTSPLIRNE